MSRLNPDHERILIEQAALSEQQRKDPHIHPAKVVLITLVVAIVIFTVLILSF